MIDVDQNRINSLSARIMKETNALHLVASIYIWVTSSISSKLYLRQQEAQLRHLSLPRYLAALSAILENGLNPWL